MSQNEHSDGDHDRTPADSYDGRIELDVRLQRIIDDLVRTAAGAGPLALAERLGAAIGAAGLPAMPANWIDAVADSAAAGNPYVVSPETTRYEPVPPPATNRPEITRD